MTSGKQARRQRQQAVVRPPVRSTQGRKASPAVIGGVAGALILLVAAVVLVLVLTRGSSKESIPTPLPETGTAVSLLRGIPQSGMFLGSPSAPVKMLEYIDLQCSSCQVFETQIMPTIIDKYVRTGKVRVD